MATTAEPAARIRGIGSSRGFLKPTLPAPWSTSNRDPADRGIASQALTVPTFPMRSRLRHPV